MRRKYYYKIQKIKDGSTWPAGSIIYAEAPCKGWRIIEKIPYRAK